MKMENIEWCLKQKRGIEIIEPNENLSNAYMKKAEETLYSMENEKSFEWKVTKAYYAMYFSLYSLLMKLGIKSEMHNRICKKIS